MSDDTRPEKAQRDLTGPMRELREYARGRLDVEHDDIARITGLVDDPEIVELLLFAAHEYDPIGNMPRSFWDTRFAQEIVRRHATKKANRAILEGDQSSAAYLTGLPSYDSDISGIQAIDRLSDWLINSEQCKVVYCAALMGRGKTDFALLLLEVIAQHYQRIRRTDGVDQSDVPRPELAGNFHAEPPAELDVDYHEFHNYDRFLEWAEGGSSDDERWFVFDEASTELTAQSGANAQKVAEIFAPFIKKMRKMGINMIVIGHDRGDVHPAIRSVASFVDKTGLKTAEIYEGIKQRDPYGHHLSISGIPPTSWTFDTDDVASWSWGTALEDDDQISEEELRDRDDLISEDSWKTWRDQRIAAAYYGSDLTQYEVAEIFDLTQSTVASICKQADQEDIQAVPARPAALGD